MSKPVIAVVGAGPGVGLAVARRFTREGFTAALIARRPEALDEYVSELRRAGAEAHGFAADAADEGSLRNAFATLKERLGAPSVLVYNAAVLKQGRPSELAVEDLLSDFRINVGGAIVAAQAVLPDMRAQKKGTILLTGGGLALTPFPAYASLAIGKAAIRNLTFSLGAEVEPDGIQVATVTICGFVKPGTHFDPDRIADAYWTLHTQEPGKREREIVYR
ncbi:SDR family NAD(P)-dependent oxidoreductase [Polyangium sp. y55x31]|uniref:SDR family NAD(P)-dependent oxidoreductase n=1 Tax=Polyangium sp. y55x31 TaxID=3042688 RepID=UPI0024831572|nr:SDR family NAD(P)-dependent oxidoreductase [Polyangium sp. y55x31]MDI1478369.1 SDR family NAD(P)-dependent oxidoreductase [Polyangium sp. y55x31]